MHEDRNLAAANAPDRRASAVPGPDKAASLIAPPGAGSECRFAPGFGRRVLLTVDTEEEFDWNAPFSRTGHGLTHFSAIPRFQQFCEETGAHPVYLVDWPVANDERAVEVLSDATRRGKADIGIQLHPWVNPPFDEQLSARNSYPGNLPREMEAAKLAMLKERVETAFGASPQIYRAGRYGAGPNTAEILKEQGIAIDTSVRSLFDYSAQGGPDFTHHPRRPYWVDGGRELLELPMTSVYSGALRQVGKHIHRAQRHVPTFFGGFARFRMLERIPLTPEGVTVEEAIRGVDIAIEEGLPLLVLSLHSPSLAPGFTPYAKSEADVERMYEWLAQVYAHLAGRGVQSATVTDIIAASGR